MECMQPSHQLGTILIGTIINFHLTVIAIGLGDIIGVILLISLGPITIGVIPILEITTAGMILGTHLGTEVTTVGVDITEVITDTDGIIHFMEVILITEIIGTAQPIKQQEEITQPATEQTQQI